MNKNVQGHIFALTANILWGLMAPIGKSALMEFSALSVTTFRMVGAAACFWLLSAFCKHEHVDHRDMLKIFFASLFALVFNQGNSSIIGDLLCLVAQISFSIYLTVFKSLSQKYSPITLNKWMFIYASMCYIPFSYHDVAGIQWTEISTAAYVQVGYVVIGGSFLAYIFIMTAQRLLRPTVVSMYNYMQPIVASIAAIIMGLGVFGWEKGVAIALVFLGVYIVTKSKSKADFEKEGKKA